MKNETKKACWISLIFLILIVPFVLAVVDYGIEGTLDDTGILEINNDLKKEPIVLKCIDEDGKDFFQKGTTSYNKEIKQDLCKNDFVIEYFCDEEIKSIKQKCENGCFEGACVKEELMTGEVILILDCEDGTKNNECSLENLGKKCIEGILISNKDCKNTEAEEIFYIYSGNVLLAKQIDGELNFVHNDYLGSLRALTDAAGNLIKKSDFFAFGEPVNDDADKFTDKALDDKTGLYYYGARYYDPFLGRFISCDPVQTEVSSYEGLGSNPLRYTDPDGNIIKERANSFKQLYPNAWKNIVASKLYQRMSNLGDMTLILDTGPHIDQHITDVFNSAAKGKIRMAFTNVYEGVDKEGYAVYTANTYFNPVLSSSNYLNQRIAAYATKYGNNIGKSLALKHTDVELELTAYHEFHRAFYRRQSGLNTAKEGTLEYQRNEAKADLWARQKDIEYTEELMKNEKDDFRKKVMGHLKDFYKSEEKRLEKEIKTLGGQK